MRRRKFITLIGGAVAGTWSLTVRAQQGERVQRIGILANGLETDAEVAARVAAFRKALQILGWNAGTNLKIDTRFAVSEGDLNEKAKELVGLGPHVILAMATPSVIALLRVAQFQLYSLR